MASTESLCAVWDYDADDHGIMWVEVQHSDGRVWRCPEAVANAVLTHPGDAVIPDRYLVSDSALDTPNKADQ